MQAYLQTIKQVINYLLLVLFLSFISLKCYLNNQYIFLKNSANYKKLS